MPPIVPDHLRQLFHGFLHEIRNPMSAVLTASSLLAEPDLLEESDFSDLVKVVEKETRHINIVVNQFDRYLHIPHAVIEKFDLARLLRTAIRDLRATKVLDSKVRLMDDLPDVLMVTGDSSQIGEAMQALLMNASQALQGNGHSPLLLAICPEESTSHVVFLIRDSGAGFTAESARRALEPFYSTRPESTGLGLPMALALIENSGGKLEIVSSEKEGEGACLRVTLNK
jgi:nitrogen fixation/metabolism regulation signal transduction histidine kinase